MSASTSSPAPRAPRQAPPQMANRVLSALLHLPLATPLSQTLLLITFTGRKSGKEFTTPVGYMRRGDEVSIFTDHDWYKNLQAHPRATLLLNGTRRTGTATVIHDDTRAIEQALWAYVQRTPAAARAYGIGRDAAGHLDRAAAQRAAERFTLIRIHLD